MEKDNNELRVLSHLMMVITIIGFSIILITLNILMHWEKWTIPLLLLSVVAAITMHVVHRPTEKLRLHILSIIIMIELFYYCVNLPMIYDDTPVVILVMIILALSLEKKLVIISFIVGMSGMVYHLIMKGTSGMLTMGTANTTRTVLCFIFVFVAFLIILKIGDVIKHIEEQHGDDMKALQRANHSASDFLANVSHEIRTPINAVIGLTGVCLEKPEGKALERELRDVEAAGKRVAEQISDILDYSEIDMAHMAVNEEEYMLSSLINDLVEQVRPIKPTELELVIDVDPKLPSVMKTDITKLKKILWHLIVNGLKYTKEGGVYVRLTRVNEPYGINLLIEVSDTGIGMTAEEMERIFERFYQGDSGRTRSSSGLGLGLSIVSGFVSALGGFMTIDSKPGDGTTVHVSLPQEVVDNGVCMSYIQQQDFGLAGFLHFEKFPHPQVREYYGTMLRDLVSGLGVTLHKVETIDNLKRLLTNVKLSHLFVGDEEYMSDPEYLEQLAKEVLVVIVANDDFKLPEGSHIRIMRKPFYCFPVISVLNMRVGDIEEEEGRMVCDGVRALVVDDEPMNLTVARGIFARYGIEVFTAASGQESIDMCREQEFDVVFMDHMMPGMDGVEAMKRIRADADREHRDLPIVALTANAVSTAREMFINEGFDGFVSKPVELIELERVMKKVLPRGKWSVVKDDPKAPVTTGEPKVTGSVGLSTTVSEPVSDNKESEDPFAALSSLGIDTRTGLRYCQDDKDFYKTLMLQFATEGEGKRHDAEGFLKSEAFSDYAIIVHAIKSTSKMIGALDLSEKARLLEEASKGKRGDEVRAGHREAMDEYAKITDGILDLFGDGQNATEEDGVLEFSPEEDDDVLEFGPEGDE